MNWPAIEETLNEESRTLKVEYMTKTTELLVATKTCTTCMQCVNVCPKNALARPILVKGVKTTKLERLPVFNKPLKCVFCGVCMVFCPYKAISMKINGNKLSSTDLPLMKSKILPSLTTVKLGKVEVGDFGFTNPFFERIINCITKKSD
nr:4Fe-4S binding protein [Candidatus Sigynarchaeota archaeon]